MKQPLLHTAPLHTIPAPHPVPSKALVHIEVEITGWQIRQAFTGFAPVGAT
jgi:hypothetical protein